VYIFFTYNFYYLTYMKGILSPEINIYVADKFLFIEQVMQNRPEAAFVTLLSPPYNVT
jgi:hypothetical protein